MSAAIHKTIDAIITSAFICSSLITTQRKRCWPGGQNGSDIYLTVSGRVKSLYKCIRCSRLSDFGGRVAILRAVIRVPPVCTGKGGHTFLSLLEKFGMHEQKKPIFPVLVI